MRKSQLSTLLFFVSLLSNGMAKTYYVCTEPNAMNSTDCHTLSYYAKNSSKFFEDKSNVSLYFLSGVYRLDTFFKVENVSHFSMMNANSSAVNISFMSGPDSNNRLEFNELKFLRMDGINFNAGKNLTIQPVLVHLHNVQEFQGSNLNFVNCSLLMQVNESVYNFIKVKFNLSTFSSSNLTIDYECKLKILDVSLDKTMLINGGVSLTSKSTTSLKLFNSNITGSQDFGVKISMQICQKEAVEVHMEHVTIRNSTLGGILCNVHESCESNTTLIPEPAGKDDDRVIVRMMHTYLLENRGRGMVFQLYPFNHSKTLHANLVDCVIEGNRKDGVSIVPYGSLEMKVQNCSFAKNKDSGLKIQHTHLSAGHMALNAALHVNNSEFDSNKFGLEVILSIVMVNITVTDSAMMSNSLSGLYVENNGILYMNCHNCSITANKYIGMYIQSASTTHVSLLHCLFERNVHYLGGFFASGDHYTVVIFASTLMIQCQPFEDTSVTISDSTFKDNADYSINNINSRTMYISQCQSVKMVGSNTFENNLGTPIQVDHSNLTVTGNLTLKNNSAFEGGGLSLVYLSTLYIQNDTMILFSDNSATSTGGGIFYSFVPGSSTTRCFYQLPESYNSISISFSNNTATNGGQDIYGTGLNTTCHVNNKITSHVAYTTVFNFTSQSLSSISSEATRVCLCDESGVPMCNYSAYILSRVDHPLYPGESITVSAVIIGEEFGTASGSVYSHLITGSEHAVSMENGQQSQRVDFRHCNQLKYTLYSPVNVNATLVLTAAPVQIQSEVSEAYVKELIKLYWTDEVSHKLLLNIPVYINVSFEDCPPGFSLTTTQPYKCKCNSRLSSGGIEHCVIMNHTGEIYRSGDIWVGAIENDSEVVVNYCPYGYCKTDNLSVDPLNPDYQCSQNRSGVLCGKCPDDLTLALGGHSCIYCPDNRYVALIIPMIIGILFLVLFIKVLNLTVSKGTINGLIFYVNIVWANEGVFFAGMDTGSGLYQITHTFLAWTNLEIGIETCFIYRLDQIGKNWFHFGQDFVYIIGVTTLIVLTSRYSILATKLLGNNTVQVLSTVFFLSYTKLFQTVINTLGFNLINHSNGTEIVWALDGNISYFGLDHSFLFLVALIAFSLFWLPYTVLLTFGPYLRKKSHFKLLKWIDKQKPYFDAYYGPLKDKYHYWFGTLLIARSVLLIVYAVTPSFAAHFNLLAIIVVSGTLLVHPYQYRNWLLSLLEKMFLLNLVFVAAGVLLAQQQHGNKSAVVYISVGLTLIALLMIIVFHIWSAIRKCIDNKKHKSKSSPVVRSAYIDIDQLSQSDDAPKFKLKADEYSQLREPLLEDVVN